MTKRVMHGRAVDTAFAKAFNLLGKMGPRELRDKMEEMGYKPGTGLFKELLKSRGKSRFKDGGLAEAIEKVKAKEMERGGEAGKGGDLIRVMKELEIMERPDKEKAKFAGRRKMLKKLIGKKEGGEAVPPKFKGFSKLPESVQQKMNPELAEKFGMGGDVKAKKSGNICRGRGIARPGTGFTIR
tara:strand:- start:462 stop:1013 length:552 start_codon:yes stop_codon:yes gene_type:complete